MLAIWRVAVRVPAAVGENRTSKVVLPEPAKGAVGLVLTVKSAALVPDLLMVSPVRSASPVLLGSLSYGGVA